MDMDMDTDMDMELVSSASGPPAHVDVKGRTAVPRIIKGALCSPTPFSNRKQLVARWLRPRAGARGLR